MTYPNILYRPLLSVLSHSSPAHVSVLEMVTGGVGQTVDQDLHLVRTEGGVETLGTDLASLALVLVDEVALVIVLVGVAPN